MPFPSQVAVLQTLVSPISPTETRQPTTTFNGIEVYRVEDLPSRTSSAIEAIGYKSSEQEFYIQWLKTGNTTKYFNVSPDIWQQFLTTQSVGSLYHRVIRGKFRGPTNPFNLVD